MWIYKISFICLCYFLSRVAMAGCEIHSNAQSSHSLCWDDKTHAWISEKCLKRECDASKFLEQHKAHKASASKASIAPDKACAELQAPLLTLKNAKGITAPFCLFSDGSVLDAAVVEKLVL